MSITADLLHFALETATIYKHQADTNQPKPKIEPASVGTESIFTQQSDLLEVRICFVLFDCKAVVPS